MVVLVPADKHHMVGKPTPLMTDLLRCVRPGGTILDPFAGSGTTGVAARIGGRRCVMVELGDGHCDIIRRIGEAVPAAPPPSSTGTPEAVAGTADEQDSWW